MSSCMIHPINTNHLYLRYTNLLLWLSVFYFYTNHKKPYIEYILAVFLIITIFWSQLFWKYPVKHSFIHTIDAIVAKITIVSFILYTILYKFSLFYLFVLLCICITSYYSNYYSSQIWCSNDHLYWHGILHICCFIATFFAFSPIEESNHLA